VTVFGRPLEADRITLTPAARRSAASIEGSGADFWLASGDYNLAVTIRGFKTSRQTIKVDRSVVWVTVPLILGTQGLDDPQILSGKLLSALPIGEIWAKLIGIYNNLTAETSVTKEGRFVFQPEPPGRYLVLVINEDRILTMQQVDLQRDTAVEIRF